MNSPDYNENEKNGAGLMSSEGLMRSIIENSPAGYLVVDNRNDSIIFFNHRFCDIWGIESLEDRMRRGEMKYSELIPKMKDSVRDVPAFIEQCKMLQSEDSGLVVRVVIPFSDNTFIGRFSTPIGDGNEISGNRLYIDMDITEPMRIQEGMLQKEHEQWWMSEEKFRTLFNAANDAVFLVDAEKGIILEANREAGELLGVPPGEIMGRHITEFYPDKKRRYYYERHKKAVNSGKHYFKNIEIWMKRPDGREVPLELNSAVLDLMGEKLAIGIFRDITERKRLERERLEQQVKAATRDSQKKINRLKKLAIQSIGLGKMEFYSESMRQVVEQAQKYHHDRSIPILIQGENGTGKKLVANIIHFGNLEDIEPPFVNLNCSTTSREVFERVLFGCEPGYCKGRMEKGQAGKINLAQGGTLFLSEVSEIPLEMQEKLLRVIEEKEYYRIGGVKRVRVDVRIICATSVDLESLVKERAFHEGLYQRLKAGQLAVPPLRQRKEDIVPMSGDFLQEFSKQRGRNFDRVGKRAAKVLLAYDWPGNVRELKNVMEWVTLMYNDSELKPSHLENLKKATGKGKRQFSQGEAEPLPPAGLPLEEFISRYVHQVLEMHDGNKAQTARYLGISRPSLYKYLKNFEPQ